MPQNVCTDVRSVTVRMGSSEDGRARIDQDKKLLITIADLAGIAITEVTS